MKNILIAFIVGVGLLVGASPQSASALSCAYTQPVVGVLTNVVIDGDIVELKLDDYKVFDPNKFTGTSEIKIDSYASIAYGYVSGDHTGLRTPDEDAFDGSVRVPLAAYNATNLEIGNVIVNGPPFHVCDYRFTGIFTDGGDLMSAIINDNYSDYTYRGSKLEVTKGDEIACESEHVCSYKVNFKVDGVDGVLSPGGSFTSEGFNLAFGGVQLLASSDVKSGDGGTEFFDWGFNTYVTYVLDLRSFDAPTTGGPGPTPVDSEEPETGGPDPLPEDPEVQSPPNPGFPDDNQEPAPTRDENPDAESEVSTPADDIPQPAKKGLFERIMGWFIGLFS